MPVEFVQEERDALEVIVWFSENTDLRRVAPGEVYEADQWYAYDGDEIVAVALVEAGIKPESRLLPEVYRLGVVESRRGESIGSSFLDRLNHEYGALHLHCRESLPANGFYEATGWTEGELRVGSPENLRTWVRREPPGEDGD